MIPVGQAGNISFIDKMTKNKNPKFESEGQTDTKKNQNIYLVDNKNEVE